MMMKFIKVVTTYNQVAFVNINEITCIKEYWTSTDKIEEKPDCTIIYLHCENRCSTLETPEEIIAKIRGAEKE